MPYQGNTPAENYAVTVKDSFSGNGAATAFTLSQPTVTNDVRVVVENVVQDPTVAYAVSGTTLTFTSAPVSGTNNIYVIHLGPAVQQVAPPATISNATTFESNVSVQGLFNSVGIDDNADATAITIDSSETVLVGKTSNTFSQQGVALRANNDSQITRDGGHPLSLNRTSSDGAVLNLYKDGSTVGGIGAVSGDLAIYSTESGHEGLRLGNGAIVPTNNSGGSTDNACNLGEATGRFSDLYLAGGIYLGGTGAANKLDDYEEGSWSPQIIGYGQSSPYTQTYSTSSGNYTKIGNQVTAHFSVTLSSKGNMSGAYSMIFGLPYNHAGSPSGTGSLWGWTNLNSAISYAAVEMGSTATVGWINYIPAAGGSQASYMNTSMISNTTSFRGTLSYRTTA